MGSSYGTLFVQRIRTLAILASYYKYIPFPNTYHTHTNTTTLVIKKHNINRLNIKGRSSWQHNCMCLHEKDRRCRSTYSIIFSTIFRIFPNKNYHYFYHYMFIINSPYYMQYLILRFIDIFYICICNL